MKVLDQALRYLSIREHSTKELITKLKLKNYSIDEIEDTVIYLKEKNYLSDERFAKLFIKYRLKKNPEGKNILLLRLVEKGIEKSIAKGFLDSYFDENEDEINELYKNYVKKIILKKGEDKAKAFLLHKQIKLQSEEF